MLGRLKPFPLYIFSISATAFGTCWLGYEYFVRGGRRSFVFDEVIVGLLITIVCMLGLAIPPRLSFRGEMTSSGQILSLSMLVVFTLFAGMLVVCLLTGGLSVLIVGLIWVLWALTVALAFLLQIAIIVSGVATLCGIVGLIYRNKFALCVFAIIPGVIIMASCSEIFNMSPKRVFDFGVFKLASFQRHSIPHWMFLYQKFRLVLAPLDFSRLLSLVISVCVGIYSGLILAMVLRWLRQFLMGFSMIRQYVPLGTAPVQDHTAVVAKSARLPLIVYSLAGWTSFLWITLF